MPVSSAPGTNACECGGTRTAIRSEPDVRKATVGNPEESDTPEIDEETRERSSEQRNITAPTPPDVRAKTDDDEDDEEPEPPAGESR